MNWFEVAHDADQMGAFCNRTSSYVTVANFVNSCIIIYMYNNKIITSFVYLGIILFVDLLIR